MTPQLLAFLTTPVGWLAIGAFFIVAEMLFEGFYLGALAVGAIFAGVVIGVFQGSFSQAVTDWTIPFALWGIGTLAGGIALKCVYDRPYDDPNEDPYLGDGDRDD